jgi:beta-lactamase superfamily II metal-dependent hydrolase
LTAGHIQTAGGANVLLTNFPTRQVFLNPARDRSAAYHDIIDQIKKTAHWQTVQSGDNVEGWSVLHPQASASFADADDNALAFFREINGHSILLLSTLGRSGQDSLGQTHPNLRADVVIAGLPARDEPLSEPLLNLLQPELIVIIDSEFPATRRAPARLRERLGRYPAPVFYCHDLGALKLVLRRDDLKLEDADGKVAWRQK